MELWRKWSGVWVAFAVTLFVYLLSRNLVYAALTAVDLRHAGVDLPGARERSSSRSSSRSRPSRCPTMHQSSLGSLFLLMPDKLAPQWWSPVMPISFFLSSIAAGTALIDPRSRCGSRRAGAVRCACRSSPRWAQITFWSLLVYLVFRLGDMAVRGQLAGAFSGRLGALFAAEIVLGGIVPLCLLARASTAAPAGRRCSLGTALAAAGVVFNRVERRAVRA